MKLTERQGEHNRFTTENGITKNERKKISRQPPRW